MLACGVGCVGCGMGRRVRFDLPSFMDIVGGNYRSIELLLRFRSGTVREWNDFSRIFTSLMPCILD